MPENPLACNVPHSQSAFNRAPMVPTRLLLLAVGNHWFELNWGDETSYREE